MLYIVKNNILPVVGIKIVEDLYTTGCIPKNSSTICRNTYCGNLFFQYNVGV